MVDNITQANEQRLVTMRQQQMETAQPAEMDPAIAERIDYINTRWPHLAPEQQLVLAKSYASDDAIDALGEMSGRQLAESDSSDVLPEVKRAVKYFVTAGAFTKNAAGAVLRNTLGLIPGVTSATKKIGDFLSEHFVDPVIKPMTRTGFALFDAVPETINNIGAVITRTDDLTTGPTDRSLTGLWKSYSIANLVDNWEEAGDGFIIGKEIREEQAKRARAFRGEYYGSAYTIGRGAASVFYKENSEGYRRLSGLVDALVNIAAPDPSKLVKKGLTAVRETTPFLTALERAELGSVAKMEMGISENIGKASLNVQKFNSYLDKNRVATRFVDDLVREKDALKIAEDYFKWDMDVDMALDLAAASTRDEVKVALARGWTIGDEALPADLAAYAKYKRNRTVIEKTLPFVRNSRAMRKVPGSEVVTFGTSAERAASARNMINSLRVAGATTEEVAAEAPKILDAFRSRATSDAVYNVQQAYRRTLKVILRKNGIAEEVIGDLVDGGYERLAGLRSWMIDRAGRETDNGFLNAMMDQFRDDFPDEFWVDFVDKYHKQMSSGAFFPDRPLQMVELLDKVVFLPNPQELRRLTRNPLLRELMTSDNLKALFAPSKVGTDAPILKKGALLNPFGTSSVKKTTVGFVPEENQAEFKAVMDEMKRFKDDLGSTPPTAADNDYIKELEERLRDLKTETKDVFTLTGEQRALYQFMDQLQNKIWKGVTLATGGYIVRNSIDAHIRMHFGAETGIFHPFDYIALITGKKRSRSVLGADLTGSKLIAGPDALNSLRKEHKEFLTAAATRQLLDNTDYSRHLFGTGQWSVVNRGQHGKTVHSQGVIQNLRQINNDPLQQIVAKYLALGKGDNLDEMFAEFKNAARTDKVYSELRSQGKMGFAFASSDGTKVRLDPIDIDALTPARQDEWFRMLMDTYVGGNVRNITGNVPDLEFMAAFNRTPKFDKRATYNMGDLVSPRKSDPIYVGSEVILPTKERGIVMDITNGQADVVPVHSKKALIGMMGDRAAMARINNMPVYDEVTKQGVPEFVRREVMAKSSSDVGYFSTLQRSMDKATDMFFGEFLDKRYIKTFERSPTYRQFYYEGVSKVIGKVDQKSADRVLTGLVSRAQKKKQTVGQYIGDEKIAKIIEDAAYGKAGQKVSGATLTDIDDYARMYALGRAKNLLYNATERNNLTDIMRVVAPFANAWREVIGTYLTQFGDDAVRVTRSFQRVYTGAKNADPDQDGRGIFYDDPRSGSLMFHFPGSKNVINLALRMAGAEPMNVQLEAPVKQMSQGLNVLPALGPMAQFAAGKVLPDNSDFAEIKSILLPYGEKDAFSLVPMIGEMPGWMNKIGQAISGDVNAQGTVFANAYIEAAKARMAMGGYDISTDEGLQILLDDARRDARIITAVRGFSQFFGPTSGRAAITVPTEQGDAVVGEVYKFLQDLQQQDYDTAVQKFIQTLGDDMVLYVGAKTRAARDGVETTAEYGKWALDNPELLEGKYRDVASYWAPPGSEMSFEVYQAQLKKGQRENLSLPEVIESAQRRIGSALYADARRQFGPYRTDLQSQILRTYRQNLHEKYPGFPQFVEFTVGELQNKIVRLNELVDDPRVQDSPLNADLKAYLEYRTQMIAQSGAVSTLSGKKRQAYRAALYQYGEQLAETNPYFKRIWNRLLVQEVDD